MISILKGENERGKRMFKKNIASALTIAMVATTSITAFASTSTIITGDFENADVSVKSYSYSVSNPYTEIEYIDDQYLYDKFNNGRPTILSIHDDYIKDTYTGARIPRDEATKQIYEVPVGTKITSDFIANDKDAHMFVDWDDPDRNHKVYDTNIMGLNNAEFIVPDENSYYVYTVYDYQPLMQVDSGFYVKGVSAKTTETASMPTTATATPTASKILVNGSDVSFDAYTINGNNYFKLRDVANILSGTAKQFEVTWDGTKSAINLVSNKAYTTVGGEMDKGDGTSKNATTNTSKIYLNGQEVALTAYTINDNNYFKLRDLGKTFDFNVSWDGTRNTIVVNSNESYVNEGVFDLNLSDSTNNITFDGGAGLIFEGFDSSFLPLEPQQPTTPLTPSAELAATAASPEAYEAYTNPSSPFYCNPWILDMVPTEQVPGDGTNSGI